MGVKAHKILGPLMMLLRRSARQALVSSSMYSGFHQEQGS